MKIPAIFISYSKEDLEAARRIEHALIGLGLSPRREGERIYASQQWQKVIGEAISTSELMLLLWSGHAAQSHFVEFEWTRAIALRKIIITCMLDNTPLAPPLGSFHGVPFQDFEKGIPTLIDTISRAGLTIDPEDGRKLLRKLQEPSPEKKEALSQAGTIAGGQDVLSSRSDIGGGAGAGTPHASKVQLAELRVGDRYRTVKMLGRGGMGAVYHVYDTDLERDVALKVIRSDLVEDPSILQRFKREIQLSSIVTHKNVLRVYDLGESEGIKFLTMQYVEGEDLSSLLKREGQLTTTRLIHIFRQICLGLAAAHERGVLHRDLKPSNILIDRENCVYLTDFGLARAISGETQSALTQTGSVMGTPHYMSPEQVKGEALDTRSDIYSLGVILYEMATGHVPYSGDTLYEVMIQRVQKPPKPATELNPDVPAYLEQIMKRCMTIEKAARYSSIEELLSDLERGVDTGHTLISTKYYLRRWRDLSAVFPWRKVAFVFPLILLLALGGLWLWQRGKAPPPGAAAVHKPISVLIADFQNRTGDPLLEGALEQALETGLEGASFVTTYNRGQARKIGGQLKEGTTSLDEALARLVAAREGINVIVGGFIARKNGGYEIAIRAIDALNGQSLTTQTVPANKKEDVLGAAGKLSARIRRTLGDTTPESVQVAAAETFTSSSLEAARFYALGAKLQGEEGKWEEAISNYQKAIALDPGLGRAYASLAVMYRNLHRPAEAEEQFRLAMKHIDRMTDREKYRTRGAYFIVIGNHPKAIEELTQLTARYPADISGQTNLALSYFYTRKMGLALEAARRAIGIYPNNLVMKGNLALFAVYASDFKTALKTAGDFLKTESCHWDICLALAISQLAEGHAPEAAQTYRKLENIAAPGPSLASSGLADIALYEGRLTEAVEILKKGIVADRAEKSAAAAARKSMALASALLDLGQKNPAMAEADKIVAQSSDASVLYEAAGIYIAAGRKEKALEIASGLGKSMREESRMYGSLIEGQVQLGEGKTWEAIRLFHEAQKLTDAWLARYELGRAYLEAAAYTEAYSEFEQCLKRRGEAAAVFLDDIPSYRYLPPVYYYMGRAQQGLGSPAAAESYRTFVAIKEKGGQDPLLKDARRRLAGF